MTDKDTGGDVPARLPCGCCGQPTVGRLEYGGWVEPCCGHDECEWWIAAGINFRNAPSVSWDEI